MEYTTEQLNYFRICYIAFSLVPQGLREIFKQEWDFRYKTTPLGGWKDTQQNGQDFYNNETQRSRAKNARCLATIQNDNTTEWDCTCLFFAILYSDSIGTTLSPAVEKDVDNLRTVRNEIAHISEAKLTDIEFNKLVGDVLSSFNSLKLSVIAAEIDTIKKQTNFPAAEVKNLKIQADNLKAELVQAKADLQTKEDELQTIDKEVASLTQEINSKVESFCNLTFMPAHEIIRRSNDVTRIMKNMEDLENGSNGAVSTIYLVGSPGCGKSQLARLIGEEIFNKRSQESTGSTFVATLNAETLETLADSYICLGRKLGITEHTLTSLVTSNASIPRGTIRDVTRLIVRLMKQFSKWVMIADNVVDLSLVRGYLPPTGSKEWGHGQVLITTRDSHFAFNAPHTYRESLTGGMHPDEAVQLLKRVSHLANQEWAEEVAAELDYQPLALATAALYAQTVVSSGSPGFSWKYYLRILRTGKRWLTEEELAKQNFAYPRTMTCAVQEAITRAVESDEVLKHVFCFLSLCAADSLPIEAVVKFVKSRATNQTEELIKEKILKSPLISCLYNEDGELAYLRVHKIVHDVCKTSLYDLENADTIECLAVAIETFHSLISAERNHVSSSEQICIKGRRNTNHCKELHEHLITSFELTDQDASRFSRFITPEDVVSWLSTIGEVCSELHDVSAADMFTSSALEFAKHMSRTQEGELLKATALSVRGEALCLQCNYKSAKEHYEKALHIRRKIYGEQHGGTATSFNSLGTVYRALGQYRLAAEQHQRALAIRRKIYGQQHDNTAISYNNLGVVYGYLGQYSLAKQQYEKALEISRKIYGEQHGRTATSYNNLGAVYRALGQHSIAKEHYEKALVITRTIYGEQHGNTAASYNNLGAVHSDFGQYSLAREYFEKALEIRRMIYGEAHGDTASSYNNLGAVYSALEQYSLAKQQHERALEIRRKIYGEQHGDTDLQIEKEEVEIITQALPEGGLAVDTASSTHSTPAYVLARGPKALAAYRRALEEGGSTYDKRVKILLVGQDRVGKTSVGKSLRGELFDENECSTDGVQMITPVMNAGTEAWRNPSFLKENITMYDEKIVEKVTRVLLGAESQPTEEEQEYPGDVNVLQNLQALKHDVNNATSTTDLQDKLNKMASDKGFIVYDNEGSGNCLFHALSDQLDFVKRIKIFHEDLRLQLVQYLKENPTLSDGTELFNFVDGYSSWPEYLKKMASIGTWGDHVVLHAAANRFKTSIQVISSLSHNLTITPECHSDSIYRLVLGHVHELHYVSLRARQVQGSIHVAQEQTQVTIPEVDTSFEEMWPYDETHRDDLTSHVKQMSPEIVPLIGSIYEAQEQTQVTIPEVDTSFEELGPYDETHRDDQTSHVEQMPPEIVPLIGEQLKKNKVEDDKIWPVIWDFAGQDIYRAIHPIFMSAEDIYLLVFDLTKKLSDKAECRVNRDGKEYPVTSRDSQDTNLDHMMRWMDLIHLLVNFDDNEASIPGWSPPPVIVVGTHADCPDPKRDTDVIRKTCQGFPEEFVQHIVKCLPIDNTKAGLETGQEKIVKLREEILDIADQMPHTKKKIPLQWHRVEKEIIKEARKGKRYLPKKAFREEIALQFCKFDKNDDFEELLYFLHARGSIVYHEHSGDKDGLVILDPQWLINVLCEIIKVEPCDGEAFSLSKDRAELQKKGILRKRLLDHACRKQKLDPIKDSLVSLMEKFNLICKWPASETEDPQILVPCMLTTTDEEEITAGEMIGAYRAPLYLTFAGTNYVPSGLFCRLVVLFGKWLSDPQHTNEYKLYANEARFALDQNHFLHLVCYKTVIKLRISEARGDSRQSEQFVNCLSRSKQFLETLKSECHWLRTMREKLCILCTACLGRSTKACWRHDRKGCQHHDCAHYIPLKSKLCCEPGVPLPLEPLQPWIEAMKSLESTDNTANEDQCTGAKIKRESPIPSSISRKKMKLRFSVPEEGSPSDEELRRLSRRLGYDWNPLAYQLGFNKGDVDGFDSNNRKLYQKAQDMLFKWKMRDGPGATYKVLCEKLCDDVLMGRKDLAKELESGRLVR